MPPPNSPAGDAPPGNGEPPYEWLDEWLCEYVDGAMDPSLETVFEQYVEANPKLKAHVERLCETRELLADAGASDPPRPPAAAPSTDASAPDPARRAPVVSDRISPFATLLSVTVALLVGFLAGTLLEDPSAASSAPEAPPAGVRSSDSPGPLTPASEALDLPRPDREATPPRSSPPDSLVPTRTP